MLKICGLDLKACLGYAERLGYIDRVPFKGLDNPRGKAPSIQNFGHLMNLRR